MAVRERFAAVRPGENVMGKVTSTFVAVALAAGPLLLPVPARAENGQITAGVVGGLIGGVLLGGAPSDTACSAASAADLLRTGAGLHRRACLPSRSRALLRRICLAIPSG